jgi:hypothetical protein
MAYPTTMPILSGLAILATIAGVSLGRSAVAEINPVHYKPPTSSFYADLVPYRSSGSVQADLAGSDYFQAEPAYSADPGCGTCDDYPVEYRPRHDKSVDGIEDGWSASTGASDIEGTAAADTAPPEPKPANRQWIERYTTYTIVTELVEPQQAQAAIPAPPAPSEDS